MVLNLVRANAYSALGQIMFDVFVTLPKSNPVRRAYSRMWHCLSKRERALCET